MWRAHGNGNPIGFATCVVSISHGHLEAKSERSCCQNIPLPSHEALKRCFGLAGAKMGSIPMQFLGVRKMGERKKEETKEWAKQYRAEMWERLQQGMNAYADKLNIVDSFESGDKRR